MEQQAGNGLPGGFEVAVQSLNGEAMRGNGAGPLFQACVDMFACAMSAAPLSCFTWALSGARPLDGASESNGVIDRVCL